MVFGNFQNGIECARGLYRGHVTKRKEMEEGRILCGYRESNSDGYPPEPKSGASANSAISAQSAAA